MFHTAALAQRQAFAGGLQIFLALVMLFARLQTFGRCLVRGCHGPVARNVLLGFFGVVLCRCSQRQAERQREKYTAIQINSPMNGAQFGA
jgi:hypothetical protein